MHRSFILSKKHKKKHTQPLGLFVLFNFFSTFILILLSWNVLESANRVHFVRSPSSGAIRIQCHSLTYKISLSTGWCNFSFPPPDRHAMWPDVFMRAIRFNHFIGSLFVNWSRGSVKYFLRWRWVFSYFQFTFIVSAGSGDYTGIEIWRRFPLAQINYTKCQLLSVTCSADWSMKQV